MHKKCFFCGSKDLVKDGLINGHQRVKCKSCGKRFVDNKRLCNNKLYNKDKECFIADFNCWYEKHKSFVNERSEPDKNGKTHYVHKRLRSAWLSLKRNMPYLWVWSDNRELGIPNTNNGMESVFTSLKTHLRLHNGMSLEHKKTFIRSFLKVSLPPSEEDSSPKMSITKILM